MNGANDSSVLQRLIDFRIEGDYSWPELAALVNVKVGTMQAAIRRGKIGPRNARKIERFLAAVDRGTALAEVK